MAEPFSLAVNVYTAFKEVYLVARFMYRTTLSAKHHVEERDQLRLEFELEFLFLQSLGQVYLTSGGALHIVRHEELDVLWANHLWNILEQMRLASLDYARLAQIEDDEYKAFSPILNDDKCNTTRLEFNIDEPLPRQPAPRFFSLDSLRWMGIRSTRKMHDSVEALNWALREKRKFEHVLREFQRLNQKLKEILPLWTAAQIKLANQQLSPATSTGRRNVNEQRLGIASHAQLRQLSSTTDPGGSNYFLSYRVVDTSSETRTITVGRIASDRRFIGNNNVLIEYKDFLPSESSDPGTSVHQRAEQLARLLGSAGAHELSTLPFQGVIEETSRRRYAFVFDYPKSTDRDKAPLSLYSMILRNDMSNRLDLHQRFKVAKIISRSIDAFHADGWVHKSIRSESVAFFHRQGSQELIVDSPYLINFEFARPEAATTKLDRDDDLERNLYRHPDRQGPPQISFSKMHDIYALGILLMEIGLWQTAASIYKQAISNLPKNAQLTPAGIQSIFISTARKRLAHHMGQSYLQAVLACLTDSFKDCTSKPDFPMMFHEEVVLNLSIRTD